MVSAVLPTPSPTPPGDPGTPSRDFGDIWHPVAHTLWAAVTASPWTIASFIVLALLMVVRLVHGLAHSGKNRDPIRGFGSRDKAELLRCAGGRCERHIWIIGRCDATTGLEADHVHPHSRGGWTNISNGQVLCKQHNRTKSARIPFNWQLKGIAKRRAAYYPAGLPGTVVRRAKRRA